MPSNQQPSTSGTQPTSSTKSPLVRSKSLRLPSSRTRGEPVPGILTRHGSMRQTKSQASTSSTVKLQPFSVLKKPFVKPKPTCINSKSTESLDKVSTKPTASGGDEQKRQLSICRSPTKHIDGHPAVKGVTFLNDSHPTPSDSPTSLQSDKSQQSQDASSSWSTPDLAVHLKRLTEEHEKLQVEYARLRMQLLENAASHPVMFFRRELQHLSHSDSHLAAIPENASGDGIRAAPDNQQQLETRVQTQEALVQSYRTEIIRLQDENRRIQRKYWEQVMNSNNNESIEDELGGASQQVVDLIDKLDDKHRELHLITGRVQELENHLSATTLELQQCQDALQDYQHMLEDANSQKEKFEKQLKETSSQLDDFHENFDFLQIERSTMAEALQEAEQSLTVTKAEMERDKAVLKELMDRSRKLYAKVQDKNLQIQLLQAELDSTQGRARDMLLSQGAELTMAALSLSQVSLSVHSILTSVSDFAATQLELQKEMLEEVMSDLDSEGEKADLSPIANSESNGPLFKVPDTSDLCGRTLLEQTIVPDVHKSAPDISTTEFLESPLDSSSSSSSERPVSIVQSIIRAIEKSSKTKPQGPKQSSLSKTKRETNSTGRTDEKVSVSSSNSNENLSKCKSDGVNSYGKENQQPGSAFKPVGLAIPFRPVSQKTREILEGIQPEDLNGEEERNKASLESQLHQMNCLLGKLVKVINLMQERYLSKMKSLTEENTQLQEELQAFKEKENRLQAELNCKSEILERTTAKVGEISMNLKATDKSYSEEKENLQKQSYDLMEKIKELEAVNAEQAQQLKEEVRKMVDAAVEKSSCGFWVDAVAICDKLVLKQEITKLRETISHKEQLLQTLAQKFSRTKKVLEDNLQQAENEVRNLDSVILKVYEILQSNPERESSETLQTLFSLVDGVTAPSEIKKIITSDIVSV